jgi:hypothetical protein
VVVVEVNGYTIEPGAKLVGASFAGADLTGAPGQNDLRGRIERTDYPYRCLGVDDLLTPIRVTAIDQ